MYNTLFTLCVLGKSYGFPSGSFSFAKLVSNQNNVAIHEHVVRHLTKPMIFLIDIVDSEHQVIVYENIPDLIQRVEWQDIFEGKSIIIDENGTEYEWDSTKKDEIGTVYDYTLIPTSRISELITECLKIVRAEQNICEFNF